MNWLAHLYLARESDAALLGALLGDFVFGRQALDRFGPVEHREILLHRRIDRFTDAHPAVAGLRAAFPDGRRRYAGIALDVYFDHLLARDWPRWSPGIALPAFTARVYAVLHARHAELPGRLQALAPRMAAHDWLGRYRERDSVDHAVSRIAGRLSRHGERLVDCLDDLRAMEAQADAAFERLWPDLIAHAHAQRPQLERALQQGPPRVGEPG